jgi:transcriptional regulator with XRE-family HTH domain
VKNKVSLRQLAKQLGVSASYLSQVKNGKRPPSQKLLSNPSFKMVSNVKHDVDADKSKSYNLFLCQRSSGVEQRFRKPSVVGSNPTAGWG